ncbi:putative udp-glucoronosyl and udp-glucosyl transferase family protein [Phaeomoniella chlamydospora]|uniref:Putative udp-glucoronosyl and udp-glucosyl transferase family protein n=1 Tax=Phaeomoniella chlamydospora TaxID=158046 RepID=A0A0G2G573_PHACM|nr:putative udp-glucoronosyl and udp-glucosyl transferase family protein [Phaeomoniella chlamydospora]
MDILYRVIGVLFLLCFTTSLADTLETPRVLFLTLSERGQANIHLATSHALRTAYGDNEVEVHFASFPDIAKAVIKVSEQAGKDIIFHPIGGRSYSEGIQSLGFDLQKVRHKPGIRGVSEFNWLVAHAAVIEETDPALIVVDTLFMPGIDAVRSLNYTYIVLSPNDVRNALLPTQPPLKALAHWPTMGSGYPYPLPWHLVPANIYLIFRLFYTSLTGSHITNLRSYVQKNGIPGGADLFNVCPENVTWLAAFSEESQIPFHKPNNVKFCGPIYMSLEPVKKQDPELSDWLEQAPTILIVLGSHTKYTESQALEIIGAIKMVLEANDQVQVLWKYIPVIEEDHSALIDQEILSLRSTGRVRVEGWLQVDPAALLESGSIVLYVNHGGANSFIEALGAGVPQVILACWVDTYDFANQAEWLGIGVWGNRIAAPDWTGEELGNSILQVLPSDEDCSLGNSNYHRRARELAIPSRERSGRFIAAEEIMKKVGEEVQQRRKRTKGLSSGDGTKDGHIPISHGDEL